MHKKRTERALAKSERFVGRLRELERALTDLALDDPAREMALIALESLVLVSRGSSETDHRQQLTLTGLQAAFELYLAPTAPLASEYAASSGKDALLADEALRELRSEYPADAAGFSVADVAGAVRGWAERYAKLV